jgi:N-hydroxyarylamine O-acetyltransferase
MTLDPDVVDAYLARIGASRDATLAELQERHLLTVPFENLSIHLGEPIVLDPAAIVAKVVDRRRGGFCYELNSAFAALLDALGHRTELLAAKVHGPDGTMGPPFDHMAVLVHDRTTGEGFLADVGFGKFATHPLPWSVRADHTDPSGVFRLVDTLDGDVDVLMDGRPQYRLETRPRALAEFGPTCWWQQTSAESHFLASLICSRLTPTGRVTLSGNLLIRTADGTRTEQTLAGDDAILAAYRDEFGFEPPVAPQVAPPLTRS